jgi:hypothetical protein
VKTYFAPEHLPRRKVKLYFAPELQFELNRGPSPSTHTSESENLLSAGNQLVFSPQNELALAAVQFELNRGRSPPIRA